MYIFRFSFESKNSVSDTSNKNWKKVLFTILTDNSFSINTSQTKRKDKYARMHEKVKGRTMWTIRVHSTCQLSSQLRNAFLPRLILIRLDLKPNQCQCRSEQIKHIAIAPVSCNRTSNIWFKKLKIQFFNKMREKKLKISSAN